MSFVRIDSQRSRQEIIAVLKHQIRNYTKSYAEADGVVRNRDALHMILHLEAALRIVKAVTSVQSK